ncbi:MAG: protein translocase subunit SecDF [Bacteroidota bacterium]
MQQGKGIIKFFLVAVTLVCLLQYFYMLPTRGVEQAADEYAKDLTQDITDEDKRDAEENAARTAYLDSMSNEVVFEIPLFKKWTYQELKSLQLAYGLDLKGGMSLVLQVDLREFIRSLANDSKDPTLDAALENASKAQSQSQSDYVALFADAFKAADPNKQLAPIFVANESLRDEIDYTSSNAEVIQVIRAKANETVGLTYDLLKERIDQLGVVQPNISLDETRDLITVELPGISNPERARSFMQSAAKLEFWNVYRINDPGVQAAFFAADEKLKQQDGLETANEEPEETIKERYEYKYDEDGNLEDSTLVYDTLQTTPDPLANQGPLLAKLQLNAAAGGQTALPPAVMGLVAENEKDEVEAFLARPEVASLFPKDLSFRWAKDAATGYNFEDEAEQDKRLYELYAIRLSKGSTTAPLEGDHITRATANPNPQNGEVEVSLMMDSEGARTWGRMTTEAANDSNREIAILLDSQVVSAPRVINPILTGSSSITGSFTLQEGKDLAKILQIGKLPARPQIIQETLVGPTLGAENIRRSITSMVVGFSLVFIFMVLYYSTGGIVSVLALLLNIFFIFGALASLGTVLTLPGIAGILLTIGMAVDANVIIYERIREELREGKTLLMSIKDGFQNSYSAIIDANVTTILVAFVLSYFGLGPIKGFAVVLIIGVIFSLFTAVLVGRLMIDYWTIDRGKEIGFWTGFSRNAFANIDFNWLGNRRLAYIISGSIIVLGFGSFFVRGFDLGVDFKGGYSYNVQFEQGLDIDPDDLRTGLAEVFGSTPTVKEVSTNNTFNIVTDYLINSTEEDVATQVQDKLFEGVNAIVGGNLKKSSFKNTKSSSTHITSSTKVGPTIADDIAWSSFYAATFALLLIFFYIFVRFSKWQYSMGAVAALFHDVLVVLSIFSIFWGILPFSLEIDQAFIAAVLTVIGYSINDTVVVFDRIREYMNRYTSKMSKQEVINKAINSTFSRTVITSLTTLFVVLVLFLFGGTSIKGFAFALVVGVIVGTYSSVFIATPVMSDLIGELEVKETKKKSFSRAAKANR